VRLKHVKEGEPIKASLFNKLIDLANSCVIDIGQGGAIVATIGPDGYMLDAVLSEPIWGQTTGAISSGTYPFKEVFPDASGAWVDGTLTDVAYEADGNTSVATGKRALFWRTAQGDWRFRAGTC
jgi:hypothetical protein